MWVPELGAFPPGVTDGEGHRLCCVQKARGVQWAEQHCHAGTRARTAGREATELVKEAAQAFLGNAGDLGKEQREPKAQCVPCSLT